MPEDPFEAGPFIRDTIKPAMEDLREYGDQLEQRIPASLWPIPSYQDMLFIK